MNIFSYSIIFFLVTSLTLYASASAQSETTEGSLQNIIPKWLSDKSPLQQHEAGISANSVVCSAGLQLIIKSKTDSPACVKAGTASALLARGWAKKPTFAVQGVTEQNYHGTEYKNGTVVDSYDIDVKTNGTETTSTAYLQIFRDGALYKRETVSISPVQPNGYRTYHVEIWPDRDASQGGYKAVLSYDNESSVVYMPSVDMLHDIFGISEIYPTKKDGMQWYMNTDNITNDGMFSTIPSPSTDCNNPMSCTLLYKNPKDGSWSAKRVDVPENEGIRLIVKAPPEDPWLNTEMTGYYRLQNSTYYPQEFTHVIRSGSPHSSLCHGYSYYLSITYDGNIAEIQKALYHAGNASGYSDTHTTSGVTTPLADRWLGMKTVAYNVNETAVKLEIWIDDMNDDQWRKVFEQTDTGWPVPGNPASYGCTNINTGLPMRNNDVISWGGTEQQFRADNAQIDFKNLSIREIIPPAS